VDATIENGMAPMVTLSTSFNYFSQISAATLDSSFVHGATVTLSNGAQSQQLKEYNAPGDVPGYQQYYYTIDSSNLSQAFLGAFNTTYYLTVVVNGQAYTALTHITSVAKIIDSLQWEQAPDNPDSTAVVIIATITDPPGLGYYARYFTSENGGPFYPGLNSVYDDEITAGTTYSVEVPRGVNRNQPIDLQTYAFYHLGDSVTIKYCNIDKATYDFWNTMEYNYQSIGNPFSTPTTVLGNVSNDALGAFCGYAAQYVSIAIPK
jgi:hypothetical protein